MVFQGLQHLGESSGLRTGGGSVDVVDDVGVDNVGCRLVLEKRGVRAAYRSSSGPRETSWMAPNSGTFVPSLSARPWRC